MPKSRNDQRKPNNSGGGDANAANTETLDIKCEMTRNSNIEDRTMSDAMESKEIKIIIDRKNPNYLYSALSSDNFRNELANDIGRIITSDCNDDTKHQFTFTFSALPMGTATIAQIVLKFTESQLKEGKGKAQKIAKALQTSLENEKVKRNLRDKLKEIIAHTSNNNHGASAYGCQHSVSTDIDATRDEYPRANAENTSTDYNGNKESKIPPRRASIIDATQQEDLQSKQSGCLAKLSACFSFVLSRMHISERNRYD